MNTHQKFMKCQEELLLKHIRFFKGEQPGVGYLDIASVVSPHMEHDNDHPCKKAVVIY